MATNTLHAAGSETTNGVGNPITLSENSLIGMFINTSAVSGTLPSLVIKLQHTPNGTDWYDVSSMSSSAIGAPALTAVNAGSGQKCGDTVRCAWSISGLNANFTFGVELVTVPS